METKVKVIFYQNNNHVYNTCQVKLLNSDARFFRYSGIRLILHRCLVTLYMTSFFATLYHFYGIEFLVQGLFAFYGWQDLHSGKILGNLLHRKPIGNSTSILLLLCIKLGCFVSIVILRKGDLEISVHV